MDYPLNGCRRTASLRNALPQASPRPSTPGYPTLLPHILMYSVQIPPVIQTSRQMKLHFSTKQHKLRAEFDRVMPAGSICCQTWLWQCEGPNPPDAHPPTTSIPNSVRFNFLTNISFRVVNSLTNFCVTVEASRGAIYSWMIYHVVSYDFCQLVRDAQ